VTLTLKSRKYGGRARHPRSLGAQLSKPSKITRSEHSSIVIAVEFDVRDVTNVWPSQRNTSYVYIYIYIYISIQPASMCAMPEFEHIYKHIYIYIYICM
jgi:hypothetical protein